MMEIQLIENVRLQSVAIEEFSKRGIRVSTIKIEPLGDDGGWRIGQAEFVANWRFEKIAREIEVKLHQRYRLKG